MAKSKKNKGDALQFPFLSYSFFHDFGTFFIKKF